MTELDRDHQKAREKVDKEFEAVRKDMLNKIKGSLLATFSGAIKTYQEVPEDARQSLYSDKSFADALAALGLQARNGKGASSNGSGSGSGKRVSEARLLAFLATERSTPAIMAEFNLKNPSQRLNKLLEEGKVTMREVDGTKLWTAAKA